VLIRSEIVCELCRRVPCAAKAPTTTRITTSATSSTSGTDGSFALDGVPTVLSDIIVAGRLGTVNGSSPPSRRMAMYLVRWPDLSAALVNAANEDGEQGCPLASFALRRGWCHGERRWRRRCPLQRRTNWTVFGVSRFLNLRRQIPKQIAG